ncbi:MAG: DUF1236 domain-containing protein [Rhodovulum sp.]|nr:DUF1236 domain-containing protein [Rhodovulum sp.]
MTPTRLVAVGLALLSGTALANAQTVISREVSQEPVETLITRGPDGITVTRRPLQSMAAPVVSTVPVFPTYGPSGEAYTRSWVQPTPVPAAPVGGSIAVRPYGEPVTTTTTRTVVIEDEEPVRPAVRTVRRGTPPIMARAVEPEPVRTTRSRTVTRRVSAAPMALAPVQRTIVYRTLVQEQTYDPAALATVTPGYGPSTGWSSTGWSSTGWAPGYSGWAAAPVARPVTYTVGSVLPETVTVAPVPRRVVVQVPETRGYEYAVVNGRVLLVEPGTNTVVADIVR